MYDLVRNTSRTPDLSDTLYNCVYRERPFKIPDTDPLGLRSLCTSLFLVYYTIHMVDRHDLWVLGWPPSIL